MKVLIGLGAVVVLFWITNPSLRDMKEFIGNKDKINDIRKTHNFIVFSIYKCEVVETDNTKTNTNDYDELVVLGTTWRKTYIGVFNNFSLTNAEYVGGNYYRPHELENTK